MPIFIMKYLKTFLFTVFCMPLALLVCSPYVPTADKAMMMTTKSVLSDNRKPQ